MRPVRVLTWHVHGNYLYYLSQASAELYLPVRPDRSNPYGGRGSTFPFGPNVHEVPAEAVRARLLVVGVAADVPDPALTPEIGRLQQVAREEGVEDLVTFVGRRGRETLK
jgi:hypothetical protein